MSKPFAHLILSGFLLAGLCGRALAAGQDEPKMLAPERLTPVEVVRLFDVYAVVQAQEFVGLDNQQYGTFVASYKAVLETRRRNQEARRKMLGELARLTRGRAVPTDESEIRDHLKALRDQETLGAAEIRKALDVVEQGLSVVQRARFTLFEEQMERRKFELLSRARQINRPGRRQQPPD